MGRFQDEMRKTFQRVVELIKNSNLFSSDTFSKDQVKAGLYKFSEDTNWLLEGHDPAIHEARCDFFKNINLHDNVGQDEIVAILEKHEILMRSQFPNTYPTNANYSNGYIAFNKANYVIENIKSMPETTVETYAHKFDQMTGADPKPFLIIDNEPKKEL